MGRLRACPRSRPLGMFGVIEVTAFGKQQRGRLQAVSGSNSSLEYHT